MRKLYLLITILVVIIISLMVTTYNQKIQYEKLLNDYKETQKSWMNESQQLKITHNQLNQQIVETRTMRLENAELQSLYSEQSRSLKMLQQSIKKHTDQAIYFSSVRRDTIYFPVDSIVFAVDSTAMPVYYGVVTDEWGTHDIIATPDTMFLTYETFDEFQFTENWDVKNKSKLIPRFLKKKELTLQVVNLNPNTSTRGLSSWRAPDTGKKPFRLLGIGFGLGVASTIYLMSR